MEPIGSQHLALLSSISTRRVLPDPIAENPSIGAKSDPPSEQYLPSAESGITDDGLYTRRSLAQGMYPLNQAAGNAVQLNNAPSAPGLKRLDNLRKQMENLYLQRQLQKALEPK